MSRQVTCINKRGDHYDPHERINQPLNQSCAPEFGRGGPIGRAIYTGVMNCARTKYPARAALLLAL
jgi:hypothetical protein